MTDLDDNAFLFGLGCDLALEPAVKLLQLRITATTRTHLVSFTALQMSTASSLKEKLSYARARHRHMLVTTNDITHSS
eukprot:1555897-Rhodomonas_salina.2